MGLIQRIVEAEGISTVSISLTRQITEKVKPPRALFVKFPYGFPLGEPDKPAQTKSILADCLAALLTFKEPGTLLDLPYKWKRTEYSEPDWGRLEERLSND